ncbi:N-acetylmuramoyl-L-alanine amidase [Desulfoprunum benzoelyticum]|nr:N-acetylmuramoyl-L-alanine amidase [Desulfoprunum benzoelyticum]
MPWIVIDDMFRFCIFLFVLVGLISSDPTVSAQPTGLPEAGQPSAPISSSPGQLYEQAKFYFNELQNNSTLARSRENWLKGTRNFRKVYLLTPKSGQAPACLYMLGNMYRSMYERFSLGIDLEESLSYYKDASRLFPEHTLADDALYLEALLYLEFKKDPKNATIALEKIIAQYPQGDFHAKAAEKLKTLSRDYDIPLPRSLVDNSQINQLVTIHPVKFWSSPEYTRIVVMADSPVTYSEIVVKEPQGPPKKLYIDFNNSYIPPDQRRRIAVQQAFLKQMRIDQIRADTVRVFLDVDEIDSYKIFSLPNPFRIIIDVHGARQSAVTAAKKPTVGKPAGSTPASSESPQSELTDIQQQPPAAEGEKQPATAVVVIRQDQKKRLLPPPAMPKEDALPKGQSKLSLAQQLGLGVRKIVLDPGHGGKDPGAIANQMQEKDIVLKIAQILKPKLAKQLNCEVILTRNEDIFLPLEERTAIANTEEADLFISLHLNAHPSQETRGLETYFLNLSTNAEAMRVAAMENATSTHQMSDLEGILSDILKNSKIDESSRLAKYVHKSMLTGLDGKNFGDVKNLGVKQAPFYVLIGAQMPSILLEIAFISNQIDAENLKNQQFVETVTDEIVKGISLYVQTTTASLSASP